MWTVRARAAAPSLWLVLSLAVACARGTSDSHQGAGGSANAHGGSVSAHGGSANAHGGTNSAGGAEPQGGGSDTSDAGAAGEPAIDYWQPTAGLNWQWQLSETVGEPLAVDVYDIDWEAEAAVVQKLHARNIRVICYVSVGSYEDFRPDAKDFPASVLGNDYEGWPGEKYVDIRSSALRAIIERRFDICARKGFDAIEPDNMDVFEIGSDSGFPLTRANGVEFADWLAGAAHARGMAIGQKNAASITADIHARYQWALTEDCYSGGRWCDDVSAYADENKPVFMCEYSSSSFKSACSFGLPKHFSPILKGMDLDAAVTFCP